MLRLTGALTWTGNLEGERYGVHFVGLFSERRDAVPICLLHGWPGMPPGLIELVVTEGVVRRLTVHQAHSSSFSTCLIC